MNSDNLISSISWLDFAEDDRRTMMEVVSLFKLRETRDELGIGLIRSAFSNLLFLEQARSKHAPAVFFRPSVWTDIKKEGKILSGKIVN